MTQINVGEVIIIIMSFNMALRFYTLVFILAILTKCYFIDNQLQYFS